MGDLSGIFKRVKIDKSTRQTRSAPLREAIERKKAQQKYAEQIRL
jgi:hypothetical protein